MMDQKTAEFYRRNVSDVFARYESVVSPLASYFQLAFPQSGQRILDIGCGSGRDLRALLEQGFDAYGTEPVDEMREFAIREFPILKDRISAQSLPGITYGSPFDGIVCSAVLMHIPLGQQLEAFINLRELLKVGGRLLLSLPAQRPDLDDEHRDPDGRLFLPMDPERIRLLAEQIGFTFLSLSQNKDALGRPEHDWNIFLFEKAGVATRPLDRVESVIKNDRKVATYKLALLRAFCDIAERDENAVTWFADGYVGMPIEALAECWLAYYWPLVAAPVHIPQSQTDFNDSKKRLSIRAHLKQLIDLASYGAEISSETAYAVLLASWKKGTYSKVIKSQLDLVLKTFAKAIITGPVRHSEGGGMYHYNDAASLVMIEADLWREFCLSSHWIRDSIILRWAGLCEDFARKNCPDIDKGIVLPFLLPNVDLKREQSIARQMYEEHPNLACVWTDKKITLASMDVDHALPFSLWRNNDLWNLLPVARKVNNEKSDKIPTPDLLRRRKDAIVETWRFANDKQPLVFKFEIERTLGRFREESWEQELFQYLSERAAVAIYRRGETPWDISVSQ